MQRIAECRFDDISDEFEFDEAPMDYVDGPLEGWAKQKSTGQWFAFACQLVVPGLVLHWTLVPVEHRSDVPSLLENASRATKGEWVSIVEDRRRGVEGSCTMVCLENKSVRPVVHPARGRPAKP